MTPEIIRQKPAVLIVETIDRSLTVDKIQWESRLTDDLGFDSLAASELLFEIEENFGMTLYEAASGNIVTIRDAVEAISRNLPQPRTAAGFA